MCIAKVVRTGASYKVAFSECLSRHEGKLSSTVLRGGSGREAALLPGFQPLPGAQVRYLARSNQQVLAAIGFGAAAWQTAPRDRFIGWTHPQRQQQLHLVVNNARFLILPWIHCKNLASRLLAMVSHRLADDWQQRYRYRPVLLETFVETPRFRGTCYKAANWIYLGQTQGRGKLHNHPCLPKKAVWVFPLIPEFRSSLCC